MCITIHKSDQFLSDIFVYVIRSFRIWLDIARHIDKRNLKEFIVFSFSCFSCVFAVSSRIQCSGGKQKEQ